MVVAVLGDLVLNAWSLREGKSMSDRAKICVCFIAILVTVAPNDQARAQRPATRQTERGAGRATAEKRADERQAATAEGQPAEDPASEALTVRNVKQERPEQQVTEHDRSPAFDMTKPAPLTKALKNQTKEGRILGFDFARDPLNSDRPFTTFDEVMKTESAARASVTAAQRKLLESRYTLQPQFDPEAKMSRGKPVPIGPTARLPAGTTWD